LCSLVEPNPKALDFNYSVDEPMWVAMYMVCDLLLVAFKFLLSIFVSRTQQRMGDVRILMYIIL
jgi:hypothetical protein